MGNGSTIQYSIAGSVSSSMADRISTSQLPIICALLDEREPAGPPEAKPHFSNLPGKDVSEDRTHADIREEVSPLANFSPAGCVIADDWVVKREIHEAREGQGTFCCDLCENPIERE